MYSPPPPPPSPPQWMWPSELFLEERHQDFLLPPGAEQTLGDGFPHIPQDDDGIQVYRMQTHFVFANSAFFTALCSRMVEVHPGNRNVVLYSARRSDMKRTDNTKCWRDVKQVELSDVAGESINRTRVWQCLLKRNISG